MAKIQQKTHDETEHLQGIIRKLTKEIKILKREIKHLNKYKNKNYESTADHAQEEETQPYEITCPDCGKGIMNLLELRSNMYAICPLCGFRKKL